MHQDDYEHDYDDQHEIAMGEVSGERFMEKIEALQRHLETLGVTEKEYEGAMLALEQKFFGREGVDAFTDSYRDEIERWVLDFSSAECDLPYEIAEYITQQQEANPRW